jgi:hypothetical protein
MPDTDPQRVAAADVPAPITGAVEGLERLLDRREWQARQKRHTPVHDRLEVATRGDGEDI